MDGPGSSHLNLLWDCRELKGMTDSLRGKNHRVFCFVAHWSLEFSKHFLLKTAIMVFHDLSRNFRLTLIHPHSRTCVQHFLIYQIINQINKYWVLAQVCQTRGLNNRRQERSSKSRQQANPRHLFTWFVLNLMHALWLRSHCFLP